MRILDKVWMVHRLTKGKPEVIYCVGTSAREVWHKIESEDVMGTGCTAAYLRTRGWRASKVGIVIFEQGEAQ